MVGLGVGRINPGQSLGDVLHINEAIVRIHPSVLIEHGGLRLATHRMLVFCGDRLHAARHDDLGAGEFRLLHQVGQPWLEVVIKSVHEQDPRISHFRHIGGSRLILLAIAVRADDGDQIHRVAGDIGHHVGNHAERRDSFDPVGRGRDAGQRQNGSDHQRHYGKNQPFHRSFPFLLARTKFAVVVASSETPYSAPAAMTIAGPDGKLR